MEMIKYHYFNQSMAIPTLLRTSSLHCY